MVNEAVEQVEIDSEKANNKKRPLDGNLEILEDTYVVLVIENEVPETFVDVGTTLQRPMMEGLQTKVETIINPGEVIAVHKERSEIENRVQKRPNIEKSHLTHKLSEEGGLSSRDQMIVMSSPILLGGHSEVDNGDKFNGTQNTVKVLNTDANDTKSASIDDINREDNLQEALQSSQLRSSIDTVRDQNGDANVTKIVYVSDNSEEDDIEEIVYSPPPFRATIGHCRRKLIVLDINGLLADIVSPPPRDYKADINIARRAIFKRPFYLDFMRFCFERFDVGVWSSRTKRNVERVTDYLFEDMKHKILFCWDSSHCIASEFNTLENKHKTLVFKDLRRIWEKHDPDLPWEKGYYNETNTLLLDDSPYKALLNPPHTAIFPYTYRYMDESDNSLGAGGDLRVYLEGLVKAENVPQYVAQHPFGQSAITETNPSWEFYAKAIGSIPSPSAST